MGLKRINKSGGNKSNTVLLSRILMGATIILLIGICAFLVLFVVMLLI